jgi:uncharacterized protein
MNAQQNKGSILITGASSGIGAVYADRLSRRGYDLILVARNGDRLRALSERLAADTGRKIEVLVADLTIPADLRRVEQRLRNDATITGLLNNAGLGASSPLLESDPDQIEKLIQLNVIALTRLTQAVAPSFVARGKGTIINIASIVALAPELLNGSYSGSKAYVLNFTLSLHQELAPKGIRVQAVLPGAINTDFWDISGLPISNLPKEWVMSADDLVDAALAGLNAGELVTIPSLPDSGEWQRLDEARQALRPNLSHTRPASRYMVN